MTKEEIFDKVKTILVTNLSVDPGQVTMDARFREDLQADSLDLVELIMEFEEQFGGEISDEDAQRLTSVGQVVDYLQKNL